ncbi:uncharacterized protein HMPREF1541_01929 [Cyphellophora europaea CBS 101466]|uniref:NmrA-like domain-containing protein n=1 Tax=Cyphellophora europaea (strain CBS 101466) TaxID=1220924 RepID=W2S233_CYPE1|nr:uncharacterized protein HMPREF1541_01929 [Cyphellophora europaea CBS 101466]ETN42771.1 hypothetical protein HMPREF1541_01929 [Cyphellophora europaea CBS 101466]
MSDQPLILITAATGTQSSSLLRTLSAWSSSTSTSITINATTRTPHSPAAQSLLTHAHTNCNIKLFETDFEDPTTLTGPTKSVTHVFLNATPVLNDVTAESRQLHNVLTALRANAATTLRRLVYTTASSVRDPSDPNSFAPSSLDQHPWMKAYYTSKYGVERAVAQLATDLHCNYTLLRPAGFLTNLFTPWMYPLLATERRIVTALHADYANSWLDPTDIGQFAAEALLTLPDTDPKYQDKYRSQIVPIAQTTRTLGQIVDALNAQLRADSKVPAGVQVELQHLSDEEAAAQGKTNPYLASQGFQNANKGIYALDLKAIEAYGLEMCTVEDFFARNADRVRRAVGLE